MKSESLIVKFFENTLSPEELTEFNELMDNNEDFRKEVEFQKELKEVILLSDRENIKQELKAIEPGARKSKFKMWPIAASFVVLLGISAFWWFSDPNVNPEELFDAQFEPYRNVVQPIERGSDTKDLRILAFRAYEEGNYDIALEGFNNLLEKYNDSRIHFYKANVLLQLGKTEEAIDILEKNMTEADSLVEKHHWYLALAYLKIGEDDKAISQLKPLINNPNSEYKKKEAQALLNKIN